MNIKENKHIWITDRMYLFSNGELVEERVSNQFSSSANSSLLVVTLEDYQKLEKEIERLKHHIIDLEGEIYD